MSVAERNTLCSTLVYHLSSDQVDHAPATLRHKLSETTVVPNDKIELIEFAKQVAKDWHEIKNDINLQQVILNRFNIRVELKLVDGRGTTGITSKILPEEKSIAVENMSTIRDTSQLTMLNQISRIAPIKYIKRVIGKSYGIKNNTLVKRNTSHYRRT